MSFDWIREHYRVPANRGGRVQYTGEAKPRLGTITGASGGRLLIRLDGEKHATPFHPTWKLALLDQNECA